MRPGGLRRPLFSGRDADIELPLPVRRGQHVVQLRELHLQLAFAAARMGARKKNVENQLGCGQ